MLAGVLCSPSSTVKECVTSGSSYWEVNIFIGTWPVQAECENPMMTCVILPKLTFSTSFILFRACILCKL